VKSSTTVPGAGSVDVDVLELVDVVVVVGTPVVDVVGAADVDVVVDTGTVLVDSNRRTVPGSDVAPGPGSDTAPLMSPLDVAGTQKTDASVMSAGSSKASGPAGSPVSRMSRHDVELGFVKQPAWFCDGQNMPVALESSLVPVVSGVSVTGMIPTSCAQTPLGHCEPLVHAAPLFGPR
jgi:hypothetical protein